MSGPPPPKRTMHAQQAVNFSDYFEMLFEKESVAGASPRRLRLTAPEGISTAGGKQALQHVLLQPEDEAEPTLTMGWVDMPKGLAKLRSYEYLAEQFRQRFGEEPFELDREGYNSLLNKVKAAFEREKIPVQVETSVKPVGGPAPAAARGPRRWWLWLLIAAALGLVLLAGWVVASTVTAGRSW